MLPFRKRWKRDGYRNVVNYVPYRGTKEPKKLVIERIKKMKKETNEHKSPWLYFAFTNPDVGIKPLCFTEPREVIIATSVAEVLPALQRIEEKVQKGFYAAGYLSYEAAPAFNHHFTVVSGQQKPLLWFGIFREPSVLPAEPRGPFSVSHWQPDTTPEEYQRKFDHVKKYIDQGEVDQINYTIRFQAQFQGDSFAFYKQLAKAQSANYSCYLRLGNDSILSISPELFFHREGHRITVRPMKGTVKRGRWYEEDQMHRQWLQESKKNQAENQMTVDLMRRELEQIAKPGTITVPQRFTIEQYPTVYQMTSTVTAQMQPEIGLKDLFKALFPCGSITGIPKEKATTIIAELETSPREVYCGAIGYLTPGGRTIFNVPIRTVWIDHQRGIATYGAGGAITRESTSEGEYQEVLAKAALLTQKMPDFRLLESIRLEDGQYFLLEEHLERLSDSAAYFGFKVDPSAIKAALLTYAEEKTQGTFKVRLLSTKEGEFQIAGEEIPPRHTFYSAVLAKKPISTKELFLYHKTTHRELYQVHRAQAPNVDEVLLWNEYRELTEFTTGNLVAEIDGQRYTPPIACGLLPGTFRRYLIQKNKIQERRLLLEDLKRCSRLWLINGVRKWVPVKLVILT